MLTILFRSTDANHIAVYLNVLAGLYGQICNFIILALAGLLARRWFAKHGSEVAIPIVAGISTVLFLAGWAVVSHLPPIPQWVPIFGFVFLAIVALLLISVPLYLVRKDKRELEQELERERKASVAVGDTPHAYYRVSLSQPRSEYGVNLVCITLTVIPKRGIILFTPSMTYRHKVPWNQGELLAICIQDDKLLQTDKEATRHYVYAVDGSTKREGRLKLTINHEYFWTDWFRLTTGESTESKKAA